MKKIILSLTLCCMASAVTHAQQLLKEVPSTAVVVVKYSGENFSQNVPLQKLDTYGFIKDDIFKMLHIDTLTSLQHIGIDFGRDIYQYVSMEDSSRSFVSILQLKNVPQFLKLIKANYGAAKKTIKKKNFNFLPVSETSYIGWNKTTAIIVNTTYQNRKNYYNYMYSPDSVTVSVADTSTAVIEMNEESDTVIVQSDSSEVISSEKTEIEDEEVIARQRADSIYNLKLELWEQQQDMIAKKQQQVVADKILSNSFSGKINSIENDPGYKKIIDPAAHASIWFNTESILNQYWNYFYKGAYNLLNAPTTYHTDTTDGFKSSVNIYFEKDRLRMEQKTFSANPKMENLANNVMNSRQNMAMLNYVNPGNIGYFSMSINTEAMANYYYSFLKKYMSNTPYMSEYADIIDVYIDLLEIIIDEKAIADLLPGNYLFVMHDMKPQLVNYTDYEYDKEFNRTEVKKSKKELSPDFTFIMETKKEGFMEKVAHLPLKYTEKEKFNYKEKGGYYELAFEDGKYPISSLYFMIKDGKVIVTTSKEVINMTINNTGFKVDEETKNSILNNNYSLQLDTKKLIEKLETQLSTDVNKKISEYLLKNMGNVKMESRLKDGMIQGTTIINIRGNHNNSLEYFFNMMDAINNIFEQDKQEKEKILN